MMMTQAEQEALAESLAESLRDWGEVLAAILPVVVGLWLTVQGIRYVRAFCKRAGLLRRLQRACEKGGWRVTGRRNGYLSVFFRTALPELTLEKNGKTLHIKFFTVLRRYSTCIFHGLNSVHPKNQLRTMLWSRSGVFNTDAYGGTGDSTLEEFAYEYDPAIPKRRDHRVKITFPPETENSGNILCIHPVAVEMRRVVEDALAPIRDGDRYEGCTLYSGHGLVKLLERE